MYKILLGVTYMTRITGEGQTYYHQSAVDDLLRERDKVERALAEGIIMPGTERAFLSEDEIAKLDAGNEDLLGVAMERQYSAIKARRNQ
jgi:hypothetical protein